MYNGNEIDNASEEYIFLIFFTDWILKFMQNISTDIARVHWSERHIVREIISKEDHLVEADYKLLDWSQKSSAGGEECHGQDWQ